MENWQIAVSYTVIAVLLMGSLFLAQACGLIDIKPQSVKKQIAGNIYGIILVADLNDKENDVRVQCKGILLKLNRLLDVALIGERKTDYNELFSMIESELPENVSKEQFKVVRVLLAANLPSLQPTTELKIHLAELEELNEILKLVIEKLSG